MRTTHPNKYRFAGAFSPVDVQRRMYGHLDVGTVEVDFEIWRAVDQLRGKSERVEEYRTHGIDLVNIKAWVRSKRRVVDEVENVAVLDGWVGVVECVDWLLSEWRKLDVY